MTEGARQFPCDKCGAKVEFQPGTDALKCPYCGQATHVPADSTAIRERDFAEVLAELERGAETEEVTSVTCGSCAALVEPPPSTEAFPCPYCGSSIVATAVSKRLIKPRALLSFRIDRTRAGDLFRRWIAGLWFAPGALNKLARLDGRLQGLYAPYWTFDARTSTRYEGQRGDNHQVTRTRTVVRNGKHVTETYTTTEIRWRPARGSVARAFDDVLVVGSSSLPRDLAEELEPWDLTDLVPYKDEYLSGFHAERYQIGPRDAWGRAAERMEDVIRKDIERDIGGDHQRVTSMHTRHDGVTLKHVLLPMWICSYRYREKIYRFLVNARTGEVQGQRPWSWVKIGAMVLLVAAVAATVYVLTR